MNNNPTIKEIQCPYCGKVLVVSIYAVTYYCLCRRKLEVKKCATVKSGPTT